MKIGDLRLIIQVVSIILINAGLFGLPFFMSVSLPLGLPMPPACHYFKGRVAECPVFQIQRFLMSGLESLSFLLIALVLFVILIIIFGRLWCGWICPLGTVPDLLTRLRRNLHIKYVKFSILINMRLSQFRYLLLATGTSISILLGLPFVSPTQRAMLEYPLCQACPAQPLWLLLQGTLHIIRWTTALDFNFWIAWPILLIFIIGSFSVRRFWCRFCPLGGLISIFKGIFAPSLIKNAQKCTKCGICARSCSLQVTEVYEKEGGKFEDVTSSRCILCLRCVEMCPEEDCLKLVWLDKPVYASKAWWREW